jgi:hypothetical protein
MEYDSLKSRRANPGGQIPEGSTPVAMINSNIDVSLFSLSTFSWVSFTFAMPPQIIGSADSLLPQRRVGVGGRTVM